MEYLGSVWGPHGSLLAHLIPEVDQWGLSNSSTGRWFSLGRTCWEWAWRQNTRREPWCRERPLKSQRAVTPQQNTCSRKAPPGDSFFFFLTIIDLRCCVNFKCCCCLVSQSCPTLCNLMDCLPGSSVHGIFQARILEWVAISSCKWSSPPRGWTHVFCRSPSLAGRFLTSEPPGTPQFQVYSTLTQIYIYILF